MKNLTLIITGLVLSFGLGYYVSSIMTIKSKSNISQSKINTSHQKVDNIKLGAFSVSLSVKDIMVSKAFYESLGFSVMGGSLEQNYLIMKNENSLIGLFHGMFDGNILTFNPGWDEYSQNIENFNDVREIQKHLRNNNIQLTAEADENNTGPASIMLSDPDGNLILIDQHR